MDIACLLQQEPIRPLKRPYPPYANLELARKARNSRGSRSYSLTSRHSRTPYSLSPLPARVKVEDVGVSDFSLLNVEENVAGEEEASQHSEVKIDAEMEE